MAAFTGKTHRRSGPSPRVLDPHPDFELTADSNNWMTLVPPHHRTAAHRHRKDTGGIFGRRLAICRQAAAGVATA